MGIPFFKPSLESQRVLCLNCRDLREKNILRLSAQITQLEKGEAALVLEELKRKKAHYLEIVSKITKKIEICQDKNLLKRILFEKTIEKEKWEKRKIWETLKIGETYSTQMCGCGCLVGYAPKKDRPYGTKRFVSAKQNESYLKRKREKELLKEFMESKKIDVAVIGKSKLARTLGHNNSEPPKKTIDVEYYEEAEKHNEEV